MIFLEKLHYRSGLDSAICVKWCKYNADSLLIGVERWRFSSAPIPHPWQQWSPFSQKSFKSIQSFFKYPFYINFYSSIKHHCSWEKMWCYDPEGLEENVVHRRTFPSVEPSLDGMGSFVKGQMTIWRRYWRQLARQSLNCLSV